jgi:perosamine synthetase
MAISLFKPTIRRKDMDSALTCMVGDNIGPGKYNQELVSSFTHLLGLAGGTALSSYYSGLILAFDLLRLEAGDKVVLSPLSPGIYMDALAARGLKPLYIGVDPDSAALLSSELEKPDFREAKAILLHYTLGFVPNMDEITASGIPIIEDISQGLGASWNDLSCGGIGDVTLLSLDPPNIITTGSGALVMVKKKQDYTQLKRILDVSPEYAMLPDLNAAVGLAQFKQLGHFLQTREDIAEVFSKALMRSKHATLVQKDGGKNIHYSFPVMVTQSMMEVRKFARKYQIETHAAFNETVITRHDAVYEAFSNAKKLLLRCVLFPLYPALGRKSVEEIAKVLTVLP